FWNTAVVKRSGDVTRLQALVDKKRIMISEEVVHEVLQLNDAEGVICLPNEEIFAGLARMGYEKPVEGLEHNKAAQQLEIVKIKARVKKLEKINKVKSSKLRRLKKVRTSQRVESSDDVENVFNQGRMIVDMDQDKGIEMVANQEKDAKKMIQRRKRVVIRDPEEELSSDTPAETPKVKDKGKGILIEAPMPMKKKDQIEMDAKYARKLQEEINKEHEEAYKNIDWNAALD
nr:hypothetical protein [Tanacetum cinerariifolium]